MARRVWKDRAVERPRTYTIQNNPDGTVTLIPAPGQIIEEGTPVNASNLNGLEEDLESHKADDAAHGWNEKKYKTVSGILSQNSDTSKTINVGFTPKLVICIANNGKYCYILNNDEVAIRFDSSGTPDSSSASGSIITTDYNTRLTSNGFKIGKYPDSDTSYLLNYVAFQ